MNHFSVSLIANEIIATYDDGTHKLVVRQMPTDDFLFDCACIVDTISLRLSKLDDKKEN